MRPPSLLALVLLVSACAADGAYTTRRAVSLPRATATGDLEAAVIEAAPAAGESRRPTRFEIESAALTRAFGRPRTVGVELVLPEAFRAGEDLVVAYHVPDAGEDPKRIAARLAGLEGLPRIVLAVLDPRGIYGHHGFVDSVNEGPNGEALVTDLIPVLEQHLFGRSATRRFVTGVGLGGWSAIHLQIEYCHAFDAAFALEPDPLDLASFYGADLTVALANETDSAVFAPKLECLRSARVEDRIASFQSALGPRGADGRPVPVLAGKDLDRDVVAAFARWDPATNIRERGAALAPRLAGKIHAIARAGDRLRRDESLRSFQAALDAASIGSAIRTPDVLDLDAVLVAAWSTMVGGPRP